ncbi:MAG TPA: hypothetical protein VGR37_18015, partial [Longimicrobiaceae bacterium]|nr:hypothetical protein [Longimicrobiaceae bacterium]
LLDTARGAVPAVVELGAAGPARVVGSDTAALYVRVGTVLLAVDVREGRVRARREGVGEDGFEVHPRGRGGYVLSRNGGVLGVAAGSLRPVWGWPERGAAGTALAVSPLGDRVYHALGGDEPRILVRDAQTGRILAERAMGGPVRVLETGLDGTLYALVGEGRLALAALRPGPEGLEELWDRALRGATAEGGVRLAVSPAEPRLAVVSPEDGGTLRVLDAATGETLSSEAGVLDAAWAADGALYVLTPEEVRLVRELRENEEGARR